MTQTIWVRPLGRAPSPGTKLRVELQQDVGGRPLHSVGHATVYEGGRVCVELIDTSAGVEAAILLREGLVDPTFWGSSPVVRLG